MALSLTTISTLKTYFNALAVSNVDIDELKFGDDEVIKTANRSDILPRPLWVQEYEDFTFEDELADNILIRKEITLTYLKVPATPSFNDKQLAMEQCEIVMKQVVAKLLKDKRDILLVSTISGWKGKVGQYQIGSTLYCGCELTMQIKDNAGLIYDAAKWL